MPTNITIKGIPDDIYERLKSKAEFNHRSINSEVIVTLSNALSSNKTDPNALITKTQAFKRKSKGMIAMDEIQEYIDRERP